MVLQRPWASILARRYWAAAAPIVVVAARRCGAPGPRLVKDLQISGYEALAVNIGCDRCHSVYAVFPEAKAVRDGDVWINRRHR